MITVAKPPAQKEPYSGSTSELQSKIDHWNRNPPQIGDIILPIPNAPASLMIQEQDTGTYRIWTNVAVPTHLPYINGDRGWYLLPPGCTGGLRCIIMSRNRDAIIAKYGKDVSKVKFEGIKVIRWSRKGTSLLCELHNWS